MLGLVRVPVDTFCNGRPAVVVLLWDGTRSCSRHLVLIDTFAVKIVLLQSTGGLQARFEDGLQVFLVNEGRSKGYITTASGLVLAVYAVWEGSLDALLDQEGLPRVGDWVDVLAISPNLFAVGRSQGSHLLQDTHLFEMVFDFSRFLFLFFLASHPNSDFRIVGVLNRQHVRGSVL